MSMCMDDLPRVRRSPRRVLLFVLILVAFTWAILEGAIWIFLRTQGFRHTTAEVKTTLVDEMPNNLVAHSRYIWLNKPGSGYVVTSKAEKATVDVKINQDGFRDEAPSERANAPFKFVALGDSFTFGWLVNHQDRWDEQLAASLSKKHAKSASVNLGMWMATFDQNALVLEDHLPTDCKLVVHLVYPSHVQTIHRHVDEFAGDRITTAFDPMLHVKDGKLLYGANPRQIMSKNLWFPYSLCAANFYRNLWRLQARIADGKHSAVTNDLDLYQKDKTEAFDNGWSLTEKAIRQTAELLKAKQIPYLVVIIPRDFQVSREEWNGKEPIEEVLTGSLPQDRLRAIVEKTQWGQFLDLLPAMRAKYTPSLYFREDAHWRPNGHRLAAEEIQAYLESSGFFLQQ